MRIRETENERESACVFVHAPPPICMRGRSLFLSGPGQYLPLSLSVSLLYICELWRETTHCLWVGDIRDAGQIGRVICIRTPLFFLHARLCMSVYLYVRVFRHVCLREKERKPLSRANRCVFCPLGGYDRWIWTSRIFSFSFRSKRVDHPDAVAWEN